MKRTILFLLLGVLIASECSGQIYYGRAKYISYRVGNIPIILSVPHGGYSTPSEIPFRTATRCGGSDAFYTGGDAYTMELTTAIRLAFEAVGKIPHVVASNLSRSKVDANRPELQAACGDPEARQAWREYHAFIQQAQAQAVADFGFGLYLDIHGHGHRVQRIELGVDISSEQLRTVSNATFDNDPSYETASTLRALSQASPWSFSDVLRGPHSFGSILARRYRSIPSSSDPYPTATQSHHWTAYSSSRHGGILMEHHRTGLRDSVANRARYAAAFVQAVREYLRTHYGYVL